MNPSPSWTYFKCPICQYIGHDPGACPNDHRGQGDQYPAGSVPLEGPFHGGIERLPPHWRCDTCGTLNLDRLNPRMCAKCRHERSHVGRSVAALIVTLAAFATVSGIAWWISTVVHW